MHNPETQTTVWGWSEGRGAGACGHTLYEEVNSKRFLWWFPKQLVAGLGQHKDTHSLTISKTSWPAAMGLHKADVLNGEQCLPLRCSPNNDTYAALHHWGVGGSGERALWGFLNLKLVNDSKPWGGGRLVSSEHTELTILQTIQSQGSLLRWLEFRMIPASICLLTGWGLEIHQFHAANRPVFLPERLLF